MQTPIYLGSICLEPARWSGDKQPTYAVSAWRERIAQAGFDGIELWANHYLKADEEEQARLRDMAPLAIFNSYAEVTDEQAAERERAAQCASELRARGVKFNTGGDAARFDEYIRNASSWAQQLPSGARLLCECHPGSAVEAPHSAARAFAQWDENRFGAMVHPFSTEPEILRAWLRVLGPRTLHAHVQIRGTDGRPTRLDQQPDAARAALKILRDGGFAGSFTIEFTLGTSTADDRTAFLWENAVRDLAFLRENWG